MLSKKKESDTEQIGKYCRKVFQVLFTTIAERKLIQSKAWLKKDDRALLLYRNKFVNFFLWVIQRFSYYFMRKKKHAILLLIVRELRHKQS